MEKEYPKGYPPSTTPIKFTTEDGKEHNGFFVADINKYVRGVNRFKDVDTSKWFDAVEVVDWDWIPTYSL